MSNIIQLATPLRMRCAEDRFAALVSSFANHRRGKEDVFWLKENAELLNILENTGQSPGDAALEIHSDFYAGIEERMAFFPQYYRFYLSLALDLEDLGLPGHSGERLVDVALRDGLADSELSDLQRMEARRLMARRGRLAVPNDTGLEERLHAFAANSSTFTLPNKKAAYELTHVVFYLSEYGRKAFELSSEALLSLKFAGTLAFLDLNADLLAEICIALRYAGQTPPHAWTSWLLRETERFTIDEDGRTGLKDDGHEYLVCNWHHALAGGRPFRLAGDGGSIRFRCGARLESPLRTMSQQLFVLGPDRSGDWNTMRDPLTETLSAEARVVLAQAEAASPVFEQFFAGFARADARRAGTR